MQKPIPATIFFVESDETVRAVADAVTRDARRLVLMALINAWVDEIPEGELAEHYIQAVALLDDSDLLLLTAWHAAHNIDLMMPSRERLLSIFPGLGVERREALRLAASFRGQDAVAYGQPEDLVMDVVLPWLSEQRRDELAQECLDIYCWDRASCMN